MELYTLTVNKKLLHDVKRNLQQHCKYNIFTSAMEENIKSRLFFNVYGIICAFGQNIL